VDRLVLKTMTAESPKAQISDSEPAAASVNALRTTRSTFQRLSWRGFAVCKNVSNCRRKFLNAGTRHDDTVTAAVSFLSDTQESPAVILSELDVEVLALNLQFFRLDDVVHFALRPPSLGSRPLQWKKNPCPSREFLAGSLLGKKAVI
jgi:hypothetical protein